jgi:multimeric flavodoxin WrbA
MKVLGVSGSPLPNSNTDRALRTVLKATGLQTEVVKLRDYSVEPCRACLGCVKTNVCVIGDGGNILCEKAKRADAIVIAGFTPYSSIDARTKAFMERLYPLRHIHGYLAGKPGAAIVTSAIPPEHPELPPACEVGLNAIRFFMLEEGIDFVGALQLTGNVPCVRCGLEGECKMSGIKLIYGPDASPDTLDVRDFEQQVMQLDAAKELGQALARALGT